MTPLSLSLSRAASRRCARNALRYVGRYLTPWKIRYAIDRRPPSTRRQKSADFHRRSQKSSGKRDEVYAAEPDDDEGIQLVRTDRWNNEQVHGGNVRRVVTQEGSPYLGGALRLITYLATLDCVTSNPSLNSSPWMRGAPQSGFSTLIRRSMRAAPCRSAVAPVGATSNASSGKHRAGWL
jgi:hypothetical protein